MVRHLAKFCENVDGIVNDQFTITKPFDTIINTNDITNINSRSNVAQNIAISKPTTISNNNNPAQPDFSQNIQRQHKFITRNKS